jgi:hypothetical protein
MSLDEQIDELYKGHLSEFVAARDALARSVGRDEAREVKRLPKPTLIPWAVNQVYWHARSTYDRLADTGRKLHAAQVAALKGRTADLRQTTEAHREALSRAVAEASRLAEAAGAHPDPEGLSRTLEAISLAREPAERPGRLTKPLQPAGFEALTGVEVAARPHVPPTATAAARKPARNETPARHEPRERRAIPARDAAAARRAAAERRRRARDIATAEKALARAKTVEGRAHAALERATRDRATAELRLQALRK